MTGDDLFELLSELRTDQRALAAEQVRISQAVAELRYAILGNGTKGLAQRVTEVENAVDRTAPARWQSVSTIVAALLSGLALVASVALRG